ncbi:hypothetical protein N7454_003036 [Penicillium verhagenii]|nr:hypothetical protein N7454_003036 [Penicillium verhagenii]
MSDPLDMSITSFDGVNQGIQIRDNSGNITANFYNSSYRPETPPSPLSTVPFARDPHFVHRHTLFDQIQARNSVPGSKIALIGLGGVGKSQLVIEYSHHVRSKSPTTWVFWLQNQKNEWICILDNADDDEFLCLSSLTGKVAISEDSIHTPTKALIEYIPLSQNGSVIITSRSREVALKMVHFKDIIDVNPMERSKALDLLRNTLNKSEDLDQSEDSLSSQQLVKELDFMPLAIVQAASFIRERGCRYSVTQYLQEFQESDREAIKLLKKEASNLNRVPEAKNSILVTWQISFDYIRHTKPSAADLLSLMSLFDREGIADTLIRPPWIKDRISDSVTCDGSSDEESSDSDDGPDFEDDVLTLKNYSFIHENNTFFAMHRLVVTYHYQGRLKEAEQLGMEVMETRKVKLGMYHLDTLLSMGNLASTYYSQFRLKEAEQPQIQFIEFFKAKLGIYHLDTLKSMSNLVLTYHSQGRLKKAEQLGIQIMETSKVKLGMYHPDTLTSTYFAQSRFDEAEKLEVQVLEMSKTKLGDHHPYTLTRMASLASTYRDQDKYDEAEQLEIHVLEANKANLGEDHPDTLITELLFMRAMLAYKSMFGEDHSDTLTCMANPAFIYRGQRRWEEAERLYLHVMQTRKTKFGVNHPDTITILLDLVTAYCQQRRWEEAEQLLVRAIESLKATLGEHHRLTLRMMECLALTWKSWGHRDTKAINLLKICIEKQTKTLGPNHPDTLSNAEQLLEWEWRVYK